MLLPLNYEPRAAAENRPAWMYVVIGLYLSLILGLVAGGCWLSYSAADGNLSKTILIFIAFAVPLLGSGALLIIVPVRARRGRPIGRRSIWLPLLGSSILFATICLGAAIAAVEFLKVEQGTNPVAIAILCVAGTIWLAWGVLFWWISRSLDPVGFSARLYKSLFAGSLLELVIAVPMHIIVRRRGECCAGIYTGTAICLGTVAAIISLGPGIFFLFHRRWKQTYACTTNSDR
jgi:hypothetical protein